MIALFLFVISYTSNAGSHAEYIKGKDACPIVINACELNMKTEVLKGIAPLLPAGKPGQQGVRGNQGERGIPGIPGLNGICEVKLLSYPSDDNVDGGHPYGTEDNPANELCSVPLNDDPYDGIITVNPAFKFQVECKKNMTCLSIMPKDLKFIEDNAFDYSKEQKPFWLSNYYQDKKAFRLQNFYGINQKQLSWLREKSTEVTQTIRYYCKNSFVNASYSTLQLLAWNDIIIGDQPTDSVPFHYTVVKSEHGCHESAPKDKFAHTDILLKGSSNRLPIIDFFIKDIRNEHQELFVEVREICFS